MSGNARRVTSSSSIGAMSMITASSGGQTQIVGQRSHSDGSDGAAAGVSLMLCQPAHAHAERQGLCDGFGALASLLDANVEDVAALRRGPATRILHIAARAACIVRSRAAPTVRSRDLIRSRDMLSRPPFGQSVRSTALAKLPVTHPRPTLTCGTRSTMIPPRSPQSRARRPAHGDGTATGSASRQRHTLPPDPPPPKGQRVTRLPRPLPRPCRQALFRQVDACLS